MTHPFPKRRPPTRGASSNGNSMPAGNTFLLSSLPPLVTIHNLKDFSQQFGTVSSIDMLVDKHTGEITGKAKVVFRNSPHPEFLSHQHFFDGYPVQITEEKFAKVSERPQPHSDEGSFSLTDLMMGVLVDDTTFSTEWQSQTTARNHLRFPPKLIVNFDQHRLILLFDFLDQRFKAHISLQSINHKIRFDKVDNEYYLTLELKRAPLLWRQERSSNRDSRSLSWRSAGSWKRVLSLLPPKSNAGDPSISPIKFYDPSQAFDNIGSWPVWRLQYSLKRNLRKDPEFFQVLHEFKNLNLADDSIVFQPIKTLSTYHLSPITNFPTGLPFHSLYCLESVLSLNYIYHRSLCPKFMDLITQTHHATISRIVEKIWAQEKLVFNPLEYFVNEINQPSILNPRIEIPAFAAMVHKVVVTPTRVCILPPTLETTNRVLRHFSHVKDRFLRVVFGDEDFRAIHSNVDENQALLKRIFNVLRVGLLIAGRHYNFLAFSSSQLREHSCWFFSECDSVKIADIHRWMGDFSTIHNVAKYAARMGQCFSSSRDVAKLKIDDYKEIPDIQNSGGFVFTDGVGKISQSLVRHIAYELELPVVPSAIQFRMGGCKGMLAMWPSLEDGEVHLRASQKKFQSNHAILEVIRVAAFSPSHLNRQIITILTSLGIAGEVFLKIQKDMVADLKRIHNDASLAIQTLVKYTDEFGVSQQLINLLSKGFLDTSDCFVKNCLRLFFTHALNELKIKARIHVPKGALLLGVADELGVLKPDQIFLQCTDPLRGDTTSVVIGECIVTRNPCFHPGDVRVVTAVDVPELHHLVNVVVFPTVGHQDIPSMCSGGDLDGDEFTVIWDPRLVPKVKDHPPMAPHISQPDYVEHVSIMDIKRFFVDYIINDNLGQIANAHLVHSDLEPTGAHHPKCLQLARLHSCAVDFAKTGTPAEFDKDLKASKFPDYMQKLDKPSYTSEKVLGILFRSLEYSDFCPVKNVGPDPRLVIEGYDEYLLNAVDTKIAYDTALRSLMNQYGIQNELEVICGYILTHREMIKKTSFQLRRQLMTSMEGIKKKFRRKFQAEFLSHGKLNLSQKVHAALLRKASAWYFASYDPTLLHRTESRLHSFAWIVGDYLGEILDALPRTFDFTPHPHQLDLAACLPSSPTPPVATSSSPPLSSSRPPGYSLTETPLTVDQLGAQLELLFN